MDHRPFETGARTVIGVAQQFESLKHEAVRMHDVFGTGERGYFTPTEDEAVTHLVVSYYQCRNALFDLIDDLRAGPDRFQLEKPRIFAVGYAAAVLLVDAARFMRDLFDVDPIVAERLDRPEPAFGIPAGLYSATQKSLTDPAHAWDLHRANGHWDRLLPKLKRESERDTRLTGILSIVEKLGDKVRVSKRQYAKARFLFPAPGKWRMPPAAPSARPSTAHSKSPAAWSAP